MTDIRKEVNCFSWEMYSIICMCYMFGFVAGWIRAWILPLSLLFLGYIYYLVNTSNKVVTKE